ncbi:hypothetical protein ACFQ1I_44245 [Kitasatospora arboriphila]
MQVQRRGLRPHQHDRPVRSHPDGRVGRQRHPATRHPGRGTEAADEEVRVVGERDPRGAGVPQPAGGDPAQRLVPGDHPAVGEVDRHPRAGRAGEPADPQLQQPQPAGLEGELQVAGVAAAPLTELQCLQQARP